MTHRFIFLEHCCSTLPGQAAARGRGYSFTLIFLADFKINKSFSVMTITRFTNGFTDPVTSAYEREWGFDRVQFIAAWRIK